MTRTCQAAALTAELKYFTGSENWYRHTLFQQFLYTDGIKFLASNAECYWLVDKIFALQYGQPSVKKLNFQTWFLTVSSDQTAILKCEDGNFNPVYSEKIIYTDFPLPQIKLFLTNNVLLLPTEY